MAMPGSILIPAATLRLAEDYVRVKALGPRPVKGLEPPWRSTRSRGRARRARVSRPLPRAASRASSAATARWISFGRRSIAPARATGRSSESSARPASGSRGSITSSLLPSDPGLARGGERFVSYGKARRTSRSPNYFGPTSRSRRARSRKIREKVTGKLLSLDRALEPALPALFGLLDVPVEDPEWQRLEPSQRRQHTLDGVKRLLLRESQVQPLLVLCEDLHWIDSETQALLDSLVESLPTARLLLLVNYRPEYQHAWSGKSYYRQLRIDPLPPETAGELLKALLGEDPTMEPLKRLLIERTEGNPFFLEESVRTLLETSVLVRERGAYRLARRPRPSRSRPRPKRSWPLDRLARRAAPAGGGGLGKDGPSPCCKRSRRSQTRFSDGGSQPSRPPSSFTRAGSSPTSSTPFAMPSRSRWVREPAGCSAPGPPPGGRSDPRGNPRGPSRPGLR